MLKYLKQFCPITAILAASLLTGCIPQMIMNSQDHDHYSQYVQNTNALNTDREKAGLQPIRIMTFDEWKTGKSTNGPAQ